MKTTKTRKDFGLFLSLAGAVVAMSGCGKTSDVSLPATGGAPSTGGGYVGSVPGSTWWGTATCGTGNYSFTNSNCLTDFVSACSQVGTVVSTGAAQTCAIPVGPVTVTSHSGILNPNDPSGPLAGNGLVVRAGDLISFAGSGTWGTSDTSTSTFLSVFHFSWSSYSCDKVNINGVGDGGTGTNQGFPMGLIGAVSGSSQVFNIGASMTNFPINNSGLLHIGMNAPSSLSGICGGYSGTLYVTVH